MTEAILIEIEHRFSRLESAVEEADLLHAARVENFSRKMLHAEQDYQRHEDYERWIREARIFERNRDSIQERRDELASAIKGCRDDLTSMLETIRRNL